MLQSHEHRLSQRRGLKQASKLFVREIPHGIHVAPFSELPGDGRASAAFISHELLFEQHVATLALATAQLRHERRYSWRHSARSCTARYMHAGGWLRLSSPIERDYAGEVKVVAQPAFGI